MRESYHRTGTSTLILPSWVSLPVGNTIKQKTSGGDRSNTMLSTDYKSQCLALREHTRLESETGKSVTTSTFRLPMYIAPRLYTMSLTRALTNLHADDPGVLFPL